MIDATDLSGNNVGKIEIMGFTKIKLNNIPDYILKFNHDPSCHTMQGITTTLMACYPELKTDSIVTILWFKTVN